MENLPKKHVLLRPASEAFKSLAAGISNFHTKQASIALTVMATLFMVAVVIVMIAFQGYISHRVRIASVPSQSRLQGMKADAAGFDGGVDNVGEETRPRRVGDQLPTSIPSQCQFYADTMSNSPQSDQAGLQQKLSECIATATQTTLPSTLPTGGGTGGTIPPWQTQFDRDNDAYFRNNCLYASQQCQLVNGRMVPVNDPFGSSNFGGGAGGGFDGYGHGGSNTWGWGNDSWGWSDLASFAWDNFGY
jgi:hypothetical protein